MSVLTDLTAAQLLAELTARRVTSLEVTQEYVDRILSLDEKVGAFLRFQSPAALEQARRIDERRAAGEPLGKLAGLPVAVKDLLCSRGEKTTCASRILENFTAPYDATAVARLKAADAVLIGRTNLD
ncbi:MAG: amidase family protein, partial [Pirellulales bacterium]